MMPGRTWIISPDKETLVNRWDKLKAAPADQMEELFTPHIRDGELGDRYSTKPITDALHGFPVRLVSVKDDKEPCIPPVEYGYRSFDRQWVIPDKRLINQANPSLWAIRSDKQVFLTALTRSSPSSGPALTISSLLPDIDHYRGSFGGRVFPLWSNEQGTEPNLKPALINYLCKTFGLTVAPEDIFSYIAAIAANPAYIDRFKPDLSTPGLRIPITADATLFLESADLGRRVLWLHSFGERMSDPTAGRPYGSPRVPVNPPSVPLAGRISSKPEDFPDFLNYDVEKQRLLVGHGFVDNVVPAVWAYEVSGKHVLTQWFSYRKLNRVRPVIGDRRPPSKLNDIQPDHWLSEYTTELLNVLNVLTLLVELEPAQAGLLKRVCAGPLLSHEALAAANALAVPPKPEKLKKAKGKQPKLF
jgi:hypothetical protein